MELGQLLILYLISNIISGQERPKAIVTIKPDQHVFREETVTLRCDIDAEGVTSWTYSWYKDGSISVFNDQEHTFWFVRMSDAGKYSCYGRETEGTQTSNVSDNITLTVSDNPKAVLSVSPQNWLNEGDPVTLICKVNGFSSGWTFSWYITDWAFSWYTDFYSTANRYGYKLLSDSSRGAGGNYTVSSAVLKHTGVYVCRAKRGKPAYSTDYSNKQLIWVSDYYSPITNLIISPNRTQHFTSVSLSLSCNSDRRRVRRYTDGRGLEYCASSYSESQEFTCTINSTNTLDTGVYWCHFKYGENMYPVNITVHSGVILESPVHPVNEGDTLTLHCLYEHSTPTRADFFKDGSLIQSQTTEMIISNVSKSHEGFYYCKHPERGESPKSWISVRERPKAIVTIKPDQHVFREETVTLRCDIDAKGVTSWKYSWYKDGSISVFNDQEHTFWFVRMSDAGKYSCYGRDTEGTQTSNVSDEVTLTVSDSPKAVLSVSPQNWLNEGDPVTLICEVNSYSTGWTFSWYITDWALSWYSTEYTISQYNYFYAPDYGYIYKLLSDSSRGAGGNYTVNSAALKHTGVYVCRATRGKPAYSTDYSNKQLIWVSDHSSPITNLIISPNGTQHLTSVSLSLSCEDQSNSKKWKVSRYTDILGLEDCESSYSESQEFTCTINSTNTLDTGVYWCHFKDGENMYPVNITVHSHVPSVSGAGVILESPFHPVTEGDSLTLHCLYQPSTPPNFRADFYKDGSLIQSQTTEMIISNVSKSHEGFYYCKHPEKGESPKSWISVRETPKPKVSIKPDQHVFRGETVTLRCDIDGGEVTIWQYSWYKDGSDGVFSELQEHTFSSVTESDAGKYFCYGAERGGSRRSQQSDAVTLRVVVLRAVLSVSPQKWLSEGDPVTLICEVNSSSTGWTFSWYTQTTSSDINDYYKLLSDSSRGAGGNYTVSSAALKHTGVYVCRAERGKPAYNTTFSNTQPLWVTSVSPPVSLIISPNRTQHFTSVSLSLSCEDQSNSDRWRVKRYTDNEQLEDCSSSVWGLQKGSICTIISSSTSDTGVYWCQSESGENYQPINITVHTGVILESPVHPLTEGDSLTLRCLYPYISQPDLRADFYKEGSLIQSQTTEMIISNVSKSHEGFYYCKHPERGESPKSWISVRAGVILESPVHPVTEGDSLTLRCLYQPSTPPNLRADFYKDGSLIQSQTTEMIISNVSKSHEGFYYCKHPERGESPKSWISVRAFDITNPMGSEVIAGLTVTFLFIVLLVLLWHYRNNKGGWSPSSVSQQKNSSQKSELNQSGGTYKTLQSESVNVPTELTYAEFELKSMKNQKKSKRYKGKTDESSDIIFRL
ncbi:Fc receptor-like protein 5 isoform X2 [Puntigrus tetrazona]|uniref:Fc receptor-like protein 5 isoform X2 n=1 Tax=Puntigrus tetrazona TaxID=1606681 RepID=UPI001C8A68D2|nr:Fc receptor-like protein 5 isoform X2 [Puntigrus tetrazona]